MRVRQSWQCTRGRGLGKEPNPVSCRHHLCYFCYRYIGYLATTNPPSYFIQSDCILYTVHRLLLSLFAPSDALRASLTAGQQLLGLAREHPADHWVIGA